MPTLAHAIHIVLVAASLTLTQAALGACVLDSGPQRTTLVELYTSEGCSSCPPADRWLSSLRSASWQDRIVPLAFHVDYWNQLGWVDRFSKPAFSERQREIATRQHSRVIYTPQVVIDGRDMRTWSSSSQFAQRVAELNRRAAGAHINATATMAEGELQLHGTVTFPSAPSSKAAWVALFHNDLTTSVAGGENAGRTLQHDFVVRTLVGPLAVTRDGNVDLDQTLHVAKDWAAAQLGVAVFAQDTSTGEVLQAVSRSSCF
jgi:hypothetical protein